MENSKHRRSSKDEEQNEARRLADLCESAYSSFCSSGGGSTLDTHLENCLQHILDEDERCFVKQVSSATCCVQTAACAWTAAG
jgi:hypothetical protein